MRKSFQGPVEHNTGIPELAWEWNATQVWLLSHLLSLSTAPKPPWLTPGCTADLAFPGWSDLLHYSDSSLGTEREMIMFGNFISQVYALPGCWKSCPESSLLFTLCCCLCLHSPQLPGTSPAVKQSPPAGTCDKSQRRSNPAVNRDRQKLYWTGTNL